LVLSRSHISVSGPAALTAIILTAITDFGAFDINSGFFLADLFNL
jgi:hypothetical protein